MKAAEIDGKQLDKFLERLSYVAVDATSDNGWEDLKAEVGNDSKRIRAFYLAVSPSLFGGYHQPPEELQARSRSYAHHRGKADRPRP